MKADPKLEILSRTMLPLPIAVNGAPLNPTEQELAAVVVAVHRAGLKFEMLPIPGYYEIGVKWFADTPLAAWRACREEVGDV